MTIHKYTITDPQPGDLITICRSARAVGYKEICTTDNGVTYHGNMEESTGLDLGKTKHVMFLDRTAQYTRILIGEVAWWVWTGDLNYVAGTSHLGRALEFDLE
jgi:hypothetical protein